MRGVMRCFGAQKNNYFGPCFLCGRTLGDVPLVHVVTGGITFGMTSLC